MYPAKDARMSAAHFQQFYPQWQDFARYIDPNFASSFWNRVTQGTAGPGRELAQSQQGQGSVRG